MLPAFHAPIPPELSSTLAPDSAVRIDAPISQFALIVPAVTLDTVRSEMCASSISSAVTLAATDGDDAFPDVSTAMTLTHRVAVSSIWNVPTAGIRARIIPWFAGSVPTRVDSSGANAASAPTCTSKWSRSGSRLYVPPLALPSSWITWIAIREPATVGGAGVDGAIVSADTVIVCVVDHGDACP